MSRIEELPDDYDENADVAPSKPEEAPSALGPAPPPKPEKQSIDDLVKDLKKSPFFMTSLDDAGDEENIELEAIRALIYEGTRAEIASNFKEQGNEEARLKHWKEARELYSKGLAALKAERKEEDPVGEEEDRKERRVKEVLHVNKALCELERGIGSLRHTTQGTYSIARKLSLMYPRLHGSARDQYRECEGTFSTCECSV